MYSDVCGFIRMTQEHSSLSPSPHSLLLSSEFLFARFSRSCHKVCALSDESFDELRIMIPRLEDETAPKSLTINQSHGWTSDEFRPPTHPKEGI